MRLSIALGFGFALSISAQGQECPEVPETGIEIGDPVPINPGDIPAGCSDFEVLVGMLKSFKKISPPDWMQLEEPASPISQTEGNLESLSETPSSAT